MASQTRPDERIPADEEKLIHALVSRGFVSRDEIQAYRQSRPAGQAEGTRKLLSELVNAGYLTKNQALRVLKDQETMIGQQIPGYQLIEKLGHGSMGTVYKGRQLSMNRIVAVKVLKPKLAANEEFLGRFYREAHIAAKLSSSTIVQAIDVGSAGDIHYFVMEYVEGRTVKEELEAGKVYQERDALEIALQVAQALDHAHRRGLIHRDVKPANVILTKEGTVKLADMGLAREAEDEELAKAEKGMTIGTPYYIAPELIRGQKEADIRADIYSLGATLYHMVTGRQPFPGNKTPEVLKAHLTEPLTPADEVNAAVSEGVSEVIEYCMAKDREQRYQTPAELGLDFECLLRGEPPKLARQHAQYSALEELTKGRVDPTQESAVVAVAVAEAPVRRASVGAAINFMLLVLLALSVVLNLILMAR
jgi:serine/threonine protein kinase